MSMKAWAALLIGLMLPVMALAEGPALQTQLPEDAALVENVEFDDGDFIRTYSLADGTSVQMLRYGSFDMTLEDLAEGEWTGYSAMETLELQAVDGYPAQGVHLTTGEDNDELNVYIVMVNADGQTLIFQVVLGKDADLTRVQDWLGGLRVVTEQMLQNG